MRSGVESRIVVVVICFTQVSVGSFNAVIIISIVNIKTSAYSTLDPRRAAGSSGQWRMVGALGRLSSPPRTRPRTRRPTAMATSMAQDT